MIENFITRIYEYDSEPDRFDIYGDGTGDFEKCSNAVTDDCLRQYRDFCLEQADLAAKILSIKNKEI